MEIKFSTGAWEEYTAWQGQDSGPCHWLRPSEKAVQRNSGFQMSLQKATEQVAMFLTLLRGLGVKAPLHRQACTTPSRSGRS